jgi:hypothetical protein
MNEGIYTVKLAASEQCHANTTLQRARITHRCRGLPSGDRCTSTFFLLARRKQNQSLHRRCSIVGFQHMVPRKTSVPAIPGRKPAKYFFIIMEIRLV